MHIIAICGMHGSGKTTVKDLFQEKGFVPVRLGITEFVKEKYGKTNEELEVKTREELRQEKGMGVMAEIVLPKIKELVEQNKNVVIENMYSWDELKIFKREFGENFVTVAVVASQETRYDRVVERNDERVQGFSEVEIREQSKSRDFSEIENIQKAGPIAMADFSILNEGTKEELVQQFEKIYEKIMQR